MSESGAWEACVAFLENGWPQRCDGRTAKECYDKGYMVAKQWMGSKAPEPPKSGKYFSLAKFVADCLASGDTAIIQHYVDVREFEKLLNAPVVKVLNTHSLYKIESYGFVVHEDWCDEAQTVSEPCFSLLTFVRDDSTNGGWENTVRALETGWPQECDGKTLSEIEKLGYSMGEKWLGAEAPEPPKQGKYFSFAKMIAHCLEAGYDGGIQFMASLSGIQEALNSPAERIDCFTYRTTRGGIYVHEKWCQGDE